MTLEEELQERYIAEGLPYSSAWLAGRDMAVLRDLAHDGVLVVDFRTDPAGEVLRAKHKWSWETLAAPDGTPRCNHPRGVDCIVSNHTHTPLYALVRPNDGGAQ